MAATLQKGAVSLPGTGCPPEAGKQLPERLVTDQVVVDPILRQPVAVEDGGPALAIGAGDAQGGVPVCHGYIADGPDLHRQRGIQDRLNFIRRIRDVFRGNAGVTIGIRDGEDGIGVRHLAHKRAQAGELRKG